MKCNSILLAGVLAALPMGAFAQEQKPTQEEKTTTTTTTTDPSGDTKIITVTGTIQSYEVGHSITLTNEKGEQVTYTLNESSQVPKVLEVGKTVTVQTTSASGTPIVKTVTVVTLTKTKKTS